MDEDLADESGQRGRRGERPERDRQAPGAFRLGAALAVLLPVPPQAPGGHDHVEHEQDRRDGRAQDREGMPVRIAVPPRNRRDEEQRRRREDETELHKHRGAADPPPPVRGHEHREPEHEQQVRDDAPDQRAAHDLRQPARDGEQRDDQLRRVSEARVQEPADSRPGVLTRVLGRLADQPGERHQGRRRDGEQRHVAGMDHVAQQNRDRAQDE